MIRQVLVVGNAVPHRQECAIVALGCDTELLDQSALPDPGLAEDCNDPAGSDGSRPHQLFQLGELGVPSQHRTAETGDTSRSFVRGPDRHDLVDVDRS